MLTPPSVWESHNHEILPRNGDLVHETVNKIIALGGLLSAAQAGKREFTKTIEALLTDGILVTSSQSTSTEARSGQ
jgi:hypothetical protein